MTDKDYALIASVIKQTVEDSPRSKSVLFTLAYRLGIEFLTDNHRFDWTKFRDACGFIIKRDKNG